MTISKVINHYGKIQSPYMGILVNHLPMGQLALYKIRPDIKGVKKYSQIYSQKHKVDPVKTQYTKINSLEECLGNRNLYESCLDIVKAKIQEEGIDNVINYVLNTYPLGISSGLFHTTIRLAYGVEGYRLEKELVDEVARALAYYITAYREAKVFTRKIDSEDFINEIIKFKNKPYIKKILDEEDSLGQRLRRFYNNKEYLEEGFVIDGTKEEKIRSLLNLLIPVYYDSRNIVILHCITGLHGIIVLKNYFNNFHDVLDILTTCIITHLKAIDNLKYGEKISDHTELSWDCIKTKASEVSDIHAIKLTYTSYELDKLYNIPELKDIALKRIKHK